MTLGWRLSERTRVFLLAPARTAASSTSSATGSGTSTSSATSTLSATFTAAGVAWKYGSVLGETCTATCASFGLPCSDSAFPTTICQGQYMQASSPELEVAWPGWLTTAVLCDAGQTGLNTPCTYSGNW